jgi:cellobiose phosphorylase
MPSKKITVVAQARANLRNGLPPLHGIGAAEARAAQTAFSRFEDRRDPRGFLHDSVHCVHALHTPRPYLHLLSSPHARARGIYGSFWDVTGRGFSCLESVLAGPITAHQDTSYVPTCPGDTDARTFYLCEENRKGAWRDEKGRAKDIWFLLPQPGRDEAAVSDFACRQGTGELEIRSRSRDLESSLHVFVAADDPLEIWTVRLRNRSRRRRRLTLFTRVHWGLRSYPAYYFDMRVVCGGLYDARNRAVAAFNHDQNNAAPRSGLLMSDTPVDGYDLSRESFDGDGVFRDFPAAVVAGRCRNSTGQAPYAGMIGALQQTVALRAGEEKTLRFVLGAAAADPRRAAAQRRQWSKKYLTGSGPARALQAARRVWNQRCRAHLIRTGNDEMDRFFNVWSKLQASHQARFVRALDMVGYRDILQDLTGICDFDPAFVRGELLEALSYQLPDGRAIRQYNKFAGAPHDLRMYMDSPVWIADALTTYLKETGDWSLLDETAGFFDPTTRRAVPHRVASVYEHALLAVRSCYRFRGRHGFCLAGHGDWNDALDGIGRGGRGVSVWLTLAVVWAAQLMRELALHRGRDREAREMAGIVSTLTRNVNRHAWDGSHYVYGFNDGGEPIGARACKEGRIHLNVNTWALLTGVAQKAGPERVAATLQAVASLDTPLGHQLLKPAYTAQSKKVGRIADMMPGLFENASLYTHGQSFVTAAFLALGRGDAAWESIVRTFPSRTLPQISTQPPHQQSNFTVGPDHVDFGKNYYGNFTGSLNWYRKNIARMLGVRADYAGLRIEPCVPGDLREYAVEKSFRGCRYYVTVHNRAGNRPTTPRIVVDGAPLTGTLIEPVRKRACRVEVWLDPQ